MTQQTKRSLIKLAAASLVAASAAGLATTAVAAEPLKVAFVYIGPVGDAGWTYA
ncbi:MAG: BMP family ABC transporter substrate-binding protein, partial [Aquabacterium sp.]